MVKHPPACRSTTACFAALLGIAFMMPSCREHETTLSAYEWTSAGQAEAGQLFPVITNRPSGPPRVQTGILDDLGRPVTVSCMSCHSTQTPNYATRFGDDLTHFHQGLHMAHAGLSCVSCHNPENYNTLRLVDGSPVEYPDVMTLCAQCHAPQYRDYQHGAHGGMSGYWDRSRGQRTRLNCIDCHDPHAPAFPHMQPTFKPRDRFLDPPKHEGSHR